MRKADYSTAEKTTGNPTSDNTRPCVSHGPAREPAALSPAQPALRPAPHPHILDAPSAPPRLMPRPKPLLSGPQRTGLGSRQSEAWEAGVTNGTLPAQRVKPLLTGTWRTHRDLSTQDHVAFSAKTSLFQATAHTLPLTTHGPSDEFLGRKPLCQAANFPPTSVGFWAVFKQELLLVLSHSLREAPSAVCSHMGAVPMTSGWPFSLVAAQEAANPLDLGHKSVIH